MVTLITKRRVIESARLPESAVRGSLRRVALACLGSAVLTAMLLGFRADAVAASITTTGSGNWSSTVADAPWPGGTLPGANDDVIVADGHTVTVDVAAQCRDLVVGQGLSGTLMFEEVNARTLTASGNVTIASGGTLQTGAAGAVRDHALVVGGSLTNGGTLDLSTNGDLAGAELRFTGAANASLSGGGGTTDLRGLTVDKGNSGTSILDLGPANLSVRGATTDVAGFLTLLNGTLRVSGSFVLTNRFFTTAAYAIPSSTGFWLDNPNVTVAAQDASPVMNHGLLRITQGSYNVGMSSGKMLGAGAGAQFVIEGGTLVVSGRLTTTQPVSYTQSGGRVHVATSGHGAMNLGSFDLSSTSSSFTMSGGTILLRQASSALSPLDYRVAAATLDITGGTVQLGDGATASRYHYRIAGALPSLVIDNTIHIKTAVLYAGNPTTRVYGNTTLHAGTMLDLNTHTLTQIGPAFINGGTLNGTAPGSRLQFLGSGAAQTFSGAGTVSNPLDGMIIDNPNGVTIDSSVPAGIRVLRVFLSRGVLTNSDKLTLGNGGQSAPFTQIGAVGLGVPAGSYDVAPILNPGAGGYSVFYFPEAGARTTGFEIPASRVLQNLIVNNPGGVNLSGGDLTVEGMLTFTTGNVVTAGHTLSLGGSGIVSRNSGHVVGRLRKQVGLGTPALTYEIGAGANYTPIDLAFSDVTAPGELTASTTSGDHPGLGSSGIQATRSANRYWTLAGAGIAFTSCSARFGFVAGDLDPGAPPDSFVVEQFSASSWSATPIGVRTPTSIQATDLTSFGDFAAGMPRSYALSVAIVGNGTMAKSPDQPSYAPGAQVTLTATAANGWHFVGWSGDGGGAQNPLLLTVDADKSITATFAINVYTLDVTMSGAGSVTKNPDQTGYAHGTAVTLTATPVPGWHFVGWSGDTNAAANPLSLTMTRGRSIGAAFERNTFALDVVVVGGGSVAKDPDQPSYASGTKVTLTATPMPGWNFVGWSGDANGTGAQISVKMDGHKSITATFAIQTHTLTVAANGKGVVTKSPDQATYDHGAVVQLTAVPAPGMRFTGWSGDASGTANPLELIMDASKNVTATFVEAHAPKVQVLYPNGGQSLVVGVEVNLRWTAEDHAGVVAVDILLSRTGPAGPYVTLAAGLPNTGSHPWTVDEPLTDKGILAVVARDSAGNSGADLSDGVFMITHPPAGVADGTQLEFGLTSVAPNPSPGAAHIRYTVAREAEARLTVLDLQGREVSVLADGLHAAGRHQRAWDAAANRAQVPTGVYFVRLQAAGRSWVRRVVLTR